MDPELLIKEINKKFGEGTLVPASDPKLKICRIPTGILSLDYLLGGGFPRGRHVELFGSASVGKTYVALRAIATAQSLGEKCVFFDTEGSFAPSFAKSIGVNLDELIYHRQRHGHQVVDLMEIMLRSNQYALIVLDSVAALIPKPELEDSADKTSYGTAQAKLMSLALRKLTAANRDSTILYTNQTRDNLSLFYKAAVTAGGRALSFYAATRVELAKIETLKKKQLIADPEKGMQEKNVPFGHRILATVVKDKSGGAKPGDSVSLVFDNEKKSVDPIEDLLYCAQSLGLVRFQQGRWEVHDKTFAHRARLVHWLSKTPDAYHKLRSRVLAELVERSRTEGEEPTSETDRTT